MKVFILFNLVLFLGIFAFCDQALSQAAQVDTDLVPAKVNGIVLGKSTYDDMLKLWGRPYHEAKFAGDPVEPKEDVPMPELLTELWYRNIEIDGEKVNAGVLIGNETRLVRSISYNIEEFTKDEAIRKFGSDYYLIITPETTCIERSQERKQNRELKSLDYPIKLVYPHRGMSVSVRSDNTVMMVNYTDKCE